jgi:cell wall-associated NlpC family hydrolase
MKGIQYLNDASGNPVRVVVDLQLYGREFALFLQQLEAKYEPKTTNSQAASSIFTNVRPPVVGDVTSAISSNFPSVSVGGSKVEKLLQTARSYIGTPYVTGGTTSSGMDCSGFTMVCFQSIGIALPRVSRDQTGVGLAVNRENIQAGDLMFFATTTPGRINHVGIASNVGGGTVKFLHASSSRGIMEADMSLDYWKKAYMTARRVI